MDSACLSSATILRCVPLADLQTAMLIIPTGLEVIFSVSLIITNRNSGWRHLLLSFESLVYLVLAVLDLLSHLLPAVRNSMTIFRIFDIVIAAISFVPVFCYVLFFILLVRAECISVLPGGLQKATLFILILTAPAIIAFNEVSSFIGISYRYVTIGPKTFFGIVFATDRDRWLWTFFTSLTLAMLTAFQAINFCLVFYRLIRAFLDQRRIESDNSDERHMYRGTGWLAVGLKLGAIETVIGFAQMSFGLVLTRRIIRFLSRAFITIGVARGLDSVENFELVRNEILSSSRHRERRTSRLRMLISNPRHSTFRQLSPTATSFHHESNNAKDVPAMSEFASLREQSQQQSRKDRVTILFPPNSAPTLQMRFSVLDMPSPSILVESIKTRSVFDAKSIAASEASAMPKSATFITDTALGRQPRRGHSTSNYSAATSIEGIHRITSQFPSLPPGVSPIADSVFIDPEKSGWKDRVPVAQEPQNPRPLRDSGVSFAAPSSISRGDLYRVTSSISSNTHITGKTRDSWQGVAYSTPATDHSFIYDAVPAALRGKKLQAPVQEKSGWVEEDLDDGAQYIVMSPKQEPSNSSTPSANEDTSSRRSAFPSRQSVIIPWLKRPVTPIAEDSMGRQSPLIAMTSSDPLTKPGLTRVKSVGKAPRHLTPAPTRNKVPRGSVAIEPIIIPPPDEIYSHTEIEYGSASTEYGGTALRDSEVLGIERQSNGRGYSTVL